MSTIETQDGTRLFFKEQGSGATIVLSHGWPLDADAWDAQIPLLAQQGYRVIAHDRRGHGRSSHTAAGHDMNTYADDLATLMDTLGLREATLIGHGAGGGEVARYIARHGTRRVSKAILIGAVPPWLVRDKARSNCVAVMELDSIRARIAVDPSTFFREFALPFYGYNRPGITFDAAVVDAFVTMAMRGAVTTHDACLTAFAQTDFTDDLKKFNVPTLFIHGGDDQLVPLACTAALAYKLVKNCTLKVYPGAQHGLCTILPDQVTADILSFLAD